jgi:hypothetical protein
MFIRYSEGNQLGVRLQLELLNPRMCLPEQVDLLCVAQEQPLPLQICTEFNIMSFYLLKFFCVAERPNLMKS